jgi:hypothetical protein
MVTMNYFCSNMSIIINMVVHSGERQQIIYKDAGKVAQNICGLVNSCTFHVVKMFLLVN